MDHQLVHPIVENTMYPLKPQANTGHILRIEYRTKLRCQTCLLFLGLLFVVSEGHGATNLKGFLGKVYELYSDYVLKVNITIYQRAQCYLMIG